MKGQIAILEENTIVAFVDHGDKDKAPARHVPHAPDNFTPEAKARWVKERSGKPQRHLPLVNEYADCPPGHELSDVTYHVEARRVVALWTPVKVERSVEDRLADAEAMIVKMAEAQGRH